MNSTLTAENWADLEIIWDYMDIKMPVPEKADAAICGGEGKMTDVAERAVELYHQGLIPLIVCSGFANPTLDGVRPEAELLAEAAIKNGVPESAVIQEPYASNTAENITKSVELIKKLNINLQKVILIHKPYMTRRFLSTALANWAAPQPELYVTSVKTTLRDFYELDKKIYGGDGRLIELMLGDYIRMKEYPKRGWMVAQPVSEPAERAYERLARAGFNAKEMHYLHREL